jgi:hypothetical protein
VLADTLLRVTETVCLNRIRAVLAEAIRKNGKVLTGIALTAIFSRVPVVAAYADTANSIRTHCSSGSLQRRTVDADACFYKDRGGSGIAVAGVGGGVQNIAPEAAAAQGTDSDGSVGNGCAADAGRYCASNKAKSEVAFAGSRVSVPEVIGLAVTAVNRGCPHRVGSSRTVDAL